MGHIENEKQKIVNAEITKDASWAKLQREIIKYFSGAQKEDSRVLALNDLVQFLHANQELHVLAAADKKQRTSAKPALNPIDFEYGIYLTRFKMEQIQERMNERAMQIPEYISCHTNALIIRDNIQFLTESQNLNDTSFDTLHDPALPYLDTLLENLLTRKDLEYGRY